MTKIECINCPAGQEVTDYYTGKTYLTENGLAFLHGKNPVSQKYAYQEGFVFAKDFQYPVLRTRQAVTEWLTALKVPRGTPLYNDLYKTLASDIPLSQPIYTKPII